MLRAFFVISTFVLLLSACTQRVVCPAFQSAYIYDKDELRKRFSYFQEDSTPKILTASKNKFLVVEPTSYRKKLRSLQTIPAKPVMVVIPDSLIISEDIMMGDDGVVPGAELDLAARSVIDSIYIEDVPQDTTEADADSTYMISKDKEIRILKYDYPDSLIYDPASGRYVAETPRYIVTEVTFNVDQDNYMWYLRNYLVLPDVRLAHQRQNSEGDVAKKKKKEKKGGFFKNLFKKKKNETDSATLNVDKPKPEFDFIEEEPEEDQAQPEPTNKTVTPQQPQDGAVTDTAADEDERTPKQKPAKKKKQKKEKKKSEKVVPQQEAPAVEEEPADDDDGF